jgi:hypothetical protein
MAGPRASVENPHFDSPGIVVAVVGSARGLNRDSIDRTSVLITNAGYRVVNRPISGRARIGSVKIRDHDPQQPAFERAPRQSEFRENSG